MNCAIHNHTGKSVIFIKSVVEVIKTLHILGVRDPKILEYTNKGVLKEFGIYFITIYCYMNASTIRTI